MVVGQGLDGPGQTGKVGLPTRTSRGVADNADGLPESEIGRAQWLADELALCGHEDITAIDILDAMSSIGLKLMPDTEGVSSHEYTSAHKAVLRSPKADMN